MVNSLRFLGRKTVSLIRASLRLAHQTPLRGRRPKGKALFSFFWWRQKDRFIFQMEETKRSAGLNLNYSFFNIQYSLSILPRRPELTNPAKVLYNNTDTPSGNCEQPVFKR